MGLSKQYLRYVPAGKFGIINSPESNIVFITIKGESDRYVAVGASEDVIIWDLKLGRKVTVIEGDQNIVTRLAVKNDDNQIAVGYSDGVTKTFDPLSGEIIQEFSGHVSPISVLTYNCSGQYLATGSMDTDVVIWDVIAECGFQRLSGHKGVITAIQFMSTRDDIIITASRDTFIKMWDLASGHCFKTLTDHITEVWSIVLIRNDTYLVAGNSTSELSVYAVKENDANFGINVNDALQELLSSNIQNIGSPIVCEKLGLVLRNGKGRVASIAVDASSQILLCHGNDKTLELFYFASDNEAIQKYNKKRKKLKTKLDKTNEDENLQRLLDEMDRTSPTSLKYVVSRLPVIMAEGKIKSIDIKGNRNKTISICLSLSNNIIESHSLSDVHFKESNQDHKISHCGHHSEMKAVVFNSDGTIIASASSSDVKIWNRATFSCLRTANVHNATCACFAPGDRYILVGTKEGSLLIVNAVSADIIDQIEAHQNDIRSIALLPNKMGCATCSTDKSAKIWNFRNFSETSGKKIDTNLSLTCTKTLELQEAAVCIRVSPDSNLLAVALLDCTVKIFFMDSFKLFLTLYGHKLPVTSMDISYDSNLIATGSSDRNVKIWGLDYGDCHKSIFAHEDTVTCLAFIPKTHYFFTCAKDGQIKQWDGDIFERVITLRGHNSEATSLSVSSNGDYLISCGQDRTIRLYEKTEEPVVLQDERETEREKEDAMTLATGKDSISIGQTPLSIIPKKTVTSEKAAELLMECLDVLNKYNDEVAIAKTTNKKQPPLPVIMHAFNAKTPEEYLLVVLRKIKTSEIEECLLLLPHASVFDLLSYLRPLLEVTCSDTEMLMRILTFLIRLNHKAIVSSADQLYPLLKRLRKLSMKRITELKDTVGINYYSLLHFQRVKERTEGISMFEEKILETNKKLAVKRKKQTMMKTALLKL